MILEVAKMWMCVRNYVVKNVYLNNYHIANLPNNNKKINISIIAIKELDSEAALP